MWMNAVFYFSIISANDKSEFNNQYNKNDNERYVQNK